MLARDTPRKDTPKHLLKAHDSKFQKNLTQFIFKYAGTYGICVIDQLKCRILTFKSNFFFFFNLLLNYNNS